MEAWQYIVIVGAAVLTAAFVMPRNRTGQTGQSTVQMETALEQFMENMEKENEEIVRLISDAQQAAKRDAERQEKGMAELDKRCADLAEELRQLKSAAAEAERGAVARQAAAAAAASAASGLPLREADAAGRPETASGHRDAGESREPYSIQTRYAELFRLYAEGKSIEAVAKKLGMNKGEVQLIIGLAKQEETARD